MIDFIINYDYKTLCGLIRDGLFTNWKFGFDSDPRLHDLNLLVILVLDLHLFNFYTSSLWRTDTVVVSKLNKLPVSIKAPLKWACNK